MDASRNIGFVSTRFAGTDGVTLEAAKWARVFEELGHRCFWFGGRLETPADHSLVHEAASFEHPEVREVQERLFGCHVRDRPTTDRIHALREDLKDGLERFIGRFDIDLLVPQNILAIPMHVPLGMAMTEIVAETRLPTIAHHHDFAWERTRFATTAVPDYLDMAFPPAFGFRFEHVVINSPAAIELARRRGLGSTVIPNVLDFDSPPPPPDEYAADLREEFEIGRDELFVLQPTRVVPRKGIEHAVELARHLQTPRRRVCLVVSHDAGDEGLDYFELLKERSVDAGIRMLFVGDRVGERRGTDDHGRKLYTLGDVYQAADFVTYPSTYEGFGNAFLEAVYFGKPILVNRYSIYLRDIEPLGFRVVAMDNVITRRVVEEVRQLLEDEPRRHAWARHNYELCRRHFSFGILRRKLEFRLHALFGE